MKVTVESTPKIVEINGVPARVWQGQTEGGIPVIAFLTRIAAERDQVRQGGNRWDTQG